MSTDRVARVSSRRGQLSDKQQRFVAEYLRDGNASRAAVAAGYSVKTAGQIGYQLLQKTSISNAIERGRSRLLQRATMKAEDVIDRLVVLASADMADIVEWDGETGHIRPFSEIDTRPIVDFSTNTTTTKKDGSVVVNQSAKVKIVNPLHAAKQLAELLGIVPKEGGGAAGGDVLVIKTYTQEDFDKIPH